MINSAGYNCSFEKVISTSQWSEHEISNYFKCEAEGMIRGQLVCLNIFWNILMWIATHKCAQVYIHVYICICLHKFYRLSMENTHFEAVKS